MRESFLIILSVLTIALAAPYARADANPVGTYTAECIGPCASDQTVTFSTTAISFTAFGHTVPFNALSLTLANLYGWDIDNGELALTDVTTGNLVLVPVDLTFPTSNEAGLFLPAPAPTPEPSLIALMLLGVGSLFLVRKRIGSGISQASRTHARCPL